MICSFFFVSYCFIFSSFHGLVVWGWGLRTDRVFSLSPGLALWTPVNNNNKVSRSVVTVYYTCGTLNSGKIKTIICLCPGESEWMNIWSHPTGPRHSIPANKTRRPNPGTSNSDMGFRAQPGLQSTTTNHTETKPLSHRSGSWKGPAHYCAGTSYSAGPRNRTSEAWVSLHIRKPKFQASAKNKTPDYYHLIIWCT